MSTLDKCDCWPEDKLEALGRCPLCGGADSAVLYEGLTDRVTRVAPGEWTLHRCSGCGSAFLDPRPTIQSIGAAYAGYYTHQQSEPEPQDPAEPPARPGALERLRWALYNGYVNRQYGYSFEPSSALGPLIMRFCPGVRHETDRRMRHLRRTRDGGRLLDVGSGGGHFLVEAKALGWQAEGLEPDPGAVAAAHARGVDVRQGVLESDTYPEDHFDAVTLDHVIEHLHDPAKSLRDCCRILKPGGILWVATPNLNSSGHRMYGRHWRGLEPPRHIVLFTPASLAESLGRAGFQVSGPLPVRFGASEWYWSASAAIEQGVDPNQPPPLSPALRRKARHADLRAWMNPRIAEEIIMLGRKPDA